LPPEPLLVQGDFAQVAGFAQPHQQRRNTDKGRQISVTATGEIGSHFASGLRMGIPANCASIFELFKLANLPLDRSQADSASTALVRRGWRCRVGVSADSDGPDRGSESAACCQRAIIHDEDSVNARLRNDDTAGCQYPDRRR
jgi:hypothetical protein